MDSYIDKRLDGRYHIERLIGEGGMANVYRGRDLLEDRTVAVKILKNEFRDNAELVRRFKNESRAISVLSQQNIVKVYDVSVSDKVQYIVMEYIEGITLKEYIEQRGEPLTYKESILFTGQVLRAIQHAHDKGIVHRDIKPQNIMLTEDGTVKVMDFGIARLARSEIHTDGEQAIGSVHYISPEQAQGANTDPRADIYSTGIMLYEMLTGKLPFESDNAVSIAIKQISDEAEPVCSVNPSVPAGLGDITMKAMSKDPKRRYQTALEMLRDIEEFKRNPSVKFEYDYLTDNEPTRYLEKVVNANRGPTAGSGAGYARAAGNNRGRRPKRKKRYSKVIPIIGGLTLATLLVCVILIYSVFQNSGNPLFTDLAEIELPNFIGMQEDDVREMLRQSPYNNLRLMEIEYEYNETAQPGQVLAQNPSSNDGKMTVKENQRLYLTVNKGVEQVAVPEVTGMTRSDARQAILDIGCRPYVVSQDSDSVQPGLVITTSPQPGELVDNTQDTVITLYVSGYAGEFDRTVPTLVGLESTDAARRLLQQYDLELGSVRTEYSDKPAGTIIGQAPDPGITRSAGSSVSVVVSDGPEPEPEPPPVTTVTVPNFVADEWTYAQALSWYIETGVEIHVTDRRSSDKDVDVIIGMDVPAGSEVEPGSKINVTVSTGPAKNGDD